MAAAFLTSLRQRLFPAGTGDVGRALAHRNFQLYAGGNAVSLIGDWMQRLAAGWLTWSLTHSGAWLGVMAMAQFFPVVLLSPLAGAVADRYHRVAIIRLAQLAGAVAATFLAVLAVAAAITVWALLALTLLLGIFNVMAQPARLALIPTLVDRTALASGMAINAISFNLARFIGPALAGFVVVRFGVGLAFAFNAVSYAVFLAALSGLRGLPKALGPSRGGHSVVKSWAEAFGYARGHPGVGPLLLLFTVTVLAVRGFSELFPGFADQIFGRGPEGLAMLTAVLGLGAIGGGLWMLLRPAITGMTAFVLANTLILSLAVLGFAATRQLPAALVCVFAAGLALSVTEIGVQTLLQAAAEDRMRGRLMALYGLVFRGGLGVSALILGTLSQRLGLRLPLALGALVAVGCWVAMRLRQPRIAASFEEAPPTAAAGPS